MSNKTLRSRQIAGSKRPATRRIKLALLISGALLNALVTIAQRLPDSSADLANIAPTTAKLPSLTQAPPETQRVGLAPQDRPSCQLPPLLTQRRHSSSGETGLKSPTTGSLDASTSNATASQLGEILSTPTNSPTISSPSVISISNINRGSASVTTATNSGVRRALDSSERLRQLRQLMASNNYDAYLITPNDEHGMEYVSDYDRRLRFLSSFTGSNGFILVTLDKAVLFTDGRYALQAEMDLDCNWSLMVSTEPVADIPTWLRHNAARGMKVATDARLMTLQTFDYLDDQFRKLEVDFVLISRDLVDIVWDVAQANSGGHSGDRFREPPKEPLFVHPLQFTGNVTWQDKLVQLGESMGKLSARHYIISQLDDIAWLLNLRGGDIPMSPLFKSYLFVTRTVEPIAQAAALQPMIRANGPQQVNSVEQLLMSASGIQSPQVVQVAPSQTIRVSMYVDLSKVDRQVRDHLQVDNVNGTIYLSKSGDEVLTTKIQVELKDYDVFIMDIRDRLAPSAGVRQLQGKLLINAAANVAIHVLAKGYEDRLVLMDSLVSKLKAVKTDSEVQGMRLAHWRDSLAISMLLSQLDADIEHRGQVNKWTEVSAAKELEFYRSLMDYNRGLSFDTISAYGANGAIVHYKPNEGEVKFIGNQSTYLLDTGGQYLDGSTDITRTLHFGEPSEFQRETYTRVLMGAIDLMSLIFEQSKYKLGDLLSRRHLFELGVDYAHGTGHGIGLFSMVHESPWLLEHYTSSASQLHSLANKQHRSQSPSSLDRIALNPPILSDPIGVRANMFTSVEPGYYRAGDFGIRLENIVVTQKVDLPWALARPNQRQEQRHAMGTEGQSEPRAQFLRFEPISLVPFEPKLTKLELLSNKQKAWLNSYNLMVRLRMTQQINYYLTKIQSMSASQQQQAPIQVQGTISSSRLYQSLLANSTGARLVSNDSSRSSVDGYYNFLRMDSAKLQAKLEQTHRWVMAKTELIPLDVPQSLVARPHLADQTRQTFRDGLQQPEDHRAAAASDGQRLVLTYMSSMPFNDAEASEALSSLRVQTASQLAGRLDNATSVAASYSPAKCSGIECDLWLLSALNPPTQRASAGLRQRHEWAQEDADSPAHHRPHGSPDESSSGESSLGSLLDAFRLSGSAAAGDGSNLLLGSVWPIVVLSSFVLLQVGILSYMCRGGERAPDASSLRRQPGSSQGPRPGSGCSAHDTRRSSSNSRGCAGHATRDVATTTLSIPVDRRESGAAQPETIG